MIFSDNGDAICCEDAYSRLASITGLFIPKTPNLGGRASKGLSVAVTLRPKRAGIRLCLMTSSSGTNKWAMSGTVLEMNDH